MSTLRLPPRAHGLGHHLLLCLLIAGSAIGITTAVTVAANASDARIGTHTTATLMATVPTTIPTPPVPPAGGTPGAESEEPASPAPEKETPASAPSTSAPPSTIAAATSAASPSSASLSPATTAPLAASSPVTTVAPRTVAAPAVAVDRPAASAKKAPKATTSVAAKATAVSYTGGLSYAESAIVGHESRGSTSAKNPRSSAFGVGQLLSGNRVKYAARCSTNAWTLEYTAQLCMMRAYIDDRYGSAARALAFRRSHGWY